MAKRRKKIIHPKEKFVYDISNPKRFGVVLSKGEQVSEVKWNDGPTRYVSNDYLKEKP